MTTFATEEISPVHDDVDLAKPTPGQKRSRKVFVSAGAAIFQRVVQAGSTLVLMPLLLRTLGPEKFGVWGAAASLAWLSGLADIGTGNALVTLVARSSAVDRVEQARRYVAGAVSIGSALGGVVLLVALVASFMSGSQGSASPYLIGGIGLALNLPLSASNNIWMALQKGYVSASWELAQTVLTTGGLIAATTRTADVRVYIAIVYAGLVLANIGSLIHLFSSRPELRPGKLWMSWPAMREVAHHGGLYFVLALIGGLAFMLDNILALALLGPEASASMTITLRICVTAAGGIAVMSQPLWPAFAEAAETADRKWILKALLRSSAVVVGLTVAASALLLLYGERLLQLWLHTNLGIGRSLLWAISAWMLAQAAIRVPNLLLNGLSILRYQVAVFLVGTVIAFTLKVALAPYLGVAGILWGTTLAVSLIVIPACVWRIWKWTNSFVRL